MSVSTDRMRAAVLAGGASIEQHNVDIMLDEAADEIDRLRGDLRRLADERQTLLSELAAERARLDWIDAELVRGGRVTFTADAYSLKTKRHVGQCELFSVTTQHIMRQNVRAVLDAARAGGG